MNKVNVEFPTITVKGKEGLQELFGKIIYVPDEELPNWNQLTQAGTYGDIRGSIDLIEICTSHFEQVLLLRSENPNLFEKFCKAVDGLNKEKERIIETHKMIKKEA